MVLNIIWEAYLIEEIAQFSQYYFDTDVESQSNRVIRNATWVDTSSEPTLLFFNQPSQLSVKCVTRYLIGKELAVATLIVLLNCDEVQSFLK